MPDRDDMEAAGFAEPDDHPIGGLSVDAGVTRYTCDRIQMIGALRETRPGRHLHLDALGALADVILAQLPEAETPFRNTEIARLKVCITYLDARIAEKDGQIAMLTKGDT